MRLEIREWGAGSPVVCLHGLSGHAGRYGPLAEHLSGRWILAPDLRGHADSAWEPPWDVATHVQDVVETIAAADVDRADWIGFSFGGRIAAALAAERPGLVDRLVLLDPALTLDPDVAAAEAAAELADEAFGSEAEAVDAKLAAGTLYSTPRAVVEREAAEHLERGDDGLLRWRYSRPMAIAAFADMAGPPPPIADVPTLLITGSKSWIPVDTEPYKTTLGANFTHISLDSGHNLLWDRFEETATAIEQFLADSPA